MKYSRMYLYVNYGIVDDLNGFLIPEYSVESKYFLDCEKAEREGICTETSTLDEVNFDNLKVRQGDVLFLIKGEEYSSVKCKVFVINLRNNTEGYVVGYYSSDDSRLYLANSVASMFKEINGVEVKNYLLYDKEQMERYVESIEQIWEENYSGE